MIRRLGPLVLETVTADDPWWIGGLGFWLYRDSVGLFLGPVQLSYEWGS